VLFVLKQDVFDIVLHHTYSHLKKSRVLGVCPPSQDASGIFEVFFGDPKLEVQNPGD